VRRVLYALLLLIVGGMAYVRLAPDDPARWHVDPRLGIDGGKAELPAPDRVVTVDRGARARIVIADTPPEDALARLDAVARATPRTTRLAGSPGEGRITWVTRSLLIGFPDYTTAAAEASGAATTIDLFARQRYGRGDMGVNAARLRDWIARLRQ